jgi:predicted phage baseplate assembly protein
MLLVDHGRWVQGEDLGEVPAPHQAYAQATGSTCDPPPLRYVAARFQPRLKEGPLTRVGTVARIVVTRGRTERVRVPFDPDASAAAAMRWRVADALPAIELPGWRVRHDLLGSGATSRDFVVETGDDGSARLRFGDGVNGTRPDAGTSFTAHYRVGNGSAGNVGSDTITLAAAADARIRSVRNPLPAQGGAEPESAPDVRRRAPQAFRTQERAVTPEDYAAMAMRDPDVQRAVGTPRWTGSWHTVFVTVDRRSGRMVDASFEGGLREALERYRMAGQDLEVDAPRYVALELELQVCVGPDHFRGDVEAALRAVLGSRDLPDGTRGLFHPDHFTFGQPVYLSLVYKAAHGVAGVDSVVVSRFQRQGTDTDEHVDAGVLEVGRLEVARLDDDPNYPERGVLRLVLHGGK